MDALALLQEVSTAYRILHTLSLEATIIMESGDENANSRNLQRIRFFYTNPNFLRFEPLGKTGVTVIADGHHLHTLSRHPHVPPGPQHSSIPLAQVPEFPQSFRWDVPVADRLLFHAIDQHVTSAEILRHEDGCHVVSVTYEPSPRSRAIITKDLLFWIDSNTHMVMRSQVDLGHRRPTEDEINWTRNSLSVQQMRLNEPIPPETFHFTAPLDSSPRSSRRGIGFGSGSGGISINPANPQQTIESHHSHHWDDDALVEVAKWKIRGKTLTFERRLIFSGADSNLTVEEHIVGPVEDHRNRYNLKV